jgi:hypothetical protein
VEDQFDSCWKCALPGQQVPGVFAELPLRLKWFHYIIAAGVSYVVPWLAILIGPVGSVSRLRGFNPAPAMWLLMSVPCAITFFILLPFLRFRARRWVALVCLLLAWAVAFTILLPPVITRAI